MTEQAVTVRRAPARPLRLGFLSFVPAREGVPGPRGSALGLADGLELFATAERLGYATGWVRQRHFERFLASPMTFLTAAAARTERLHLGTAVVPARWEQPVRLAADATTLDLLCGHRLEVGLGGGLPGTEAALAAVYGGAADDPAAEAAARVARFRAAVAGEPLAEVPDGCASVPAGGALHLTPPSPQLVERLWYGTGTRARAAWAGEAGYHLLLSTLVGEETGVRADVAQVEQARVWRAAREVAGHERPGRVAVGRIVLPVSSPAEGEEFAGFLAGYRSGMDGAGRPLPGTAAAPVRFTPVLTGSPHEVAEQLAADAMTGEADELVVTLPAEGSPAAHRRVLELVATEVAPELAALTGRPVSRG